MEFHINFYDGGSGEIPGPSDWDIRIFAKVPAEEIEAWTNGLEPAEEVVTEWLKALPKAPDQLEEFEWVSGGKRLVGCHRKSR